MVKAGELSPDGNRFESCIDCKNFNHFIGYDKIFTRDVLWGEIESLRLNENVLNTNPAAYGCRVFYCKV